MLQPSPAKLPETARDSRHLHLSSVPDGRPSVFQNQHLFEIRTALSRVDSSTCASAPVHLRRSRAGSADPGAAGRGHDADGHLPGHRHPGGGDGLAVHGPLAAADGQPDHRAVGAVADDHRQQHRAHRVSVAERHRGHQDLLPAQGEHRERGRAGHRHRADAGAAAAARHDAAPHPSVQRLQRPHHPAGPLGRGAVRAAAQRLRAEHHPDAAGHRRRRRYPLPLRRQAAAGAGRPGPARAAGQGAVARRRRQHHRRAERDPALRHGQDRPLRVRGRDQQHAAEAGRAQ